MNLLFSQSLTQFAVRGFTYLVLLVVIPSFISITTVEEYTSFVLLSTLIALAPLFDGGHAVALSRWCISAKEKKVSKKEESEQIFFALKGSIFWSLVISSCASFFWILLFNKNVKINLLIEYTLIYSFAAVATTISNVVTRFILVKKLDAAYILVVISGPIMIAVLLIGCRYFKIKDFMVIGLAFCLGGLIEFLFFIVLYLKKNKDIFFNRVKFFKKNAEHQDSKSYRFSIFFSQIVSIFVVMKNPILIRYLCGDLELSRFSLYSAMSALMIAPVAAMQISLFTRYANKKNQNAIFQLPEYFRDILTATLSGALIAGLFYVCLVWLEISVINDLHAIELNSYGIVFICSVVYISSVICGVYFSATGQGGVIKITAIVVLILDIAFVFLLSDVYKGLTPIITIALSNLISYSLYIAYLGYRKNE